ncbi:LOW QUALITY PROTEIN: zinc finger protein 91-like [Gadus chalcogrammus]|uniref:LOW QUALITY PROTEIN: zinc finger protein 91-like n=1 Tax=Gadus chalcogrammus TaxID=1042646 RepID=UPI0024C21B52|nr:LOW QUALITY PROTEIN: zinc finger protein 91-like [Gadus chalcogrammus]
MESRSVPTLLGSATNRRQQLLSRDVACQTDHRLSLKTLRTRFKSEEDCDSFVDRSTQRGATSESLGVDAPGSSHLASHREELKIYGKGEGPLAVDGHDTLFAASELEALSSLSADHSVAKSLNCSVRLVRLEELTGHQGGRKGRPGVLCGKVIPNNANMIVHMRTHSGEKPYKCDQCKKSFTERANLKTHMRTHTGEKPYSCDQCKKSFGRKQHLKIHMRTHTGEKPYSCDQCKKSFGRISTLRIHIKTHTGEKPYKCDQCMKPFSRKQHLKIHMRTHTGEKPYKCDQCKKSFGQKCNLQFHMRLNTGEKPYSCDQCTMRFAESSALKIHMRTHPPTEGSCSVFGCTNEHKSIFLVPSSEPLKNQWVDFIFSGNDVGVCAKHFTEDCFLNLGQYRTGLAQRLKMDSRSVPTLLGSATNRRQQLLSRDVACQTDHLETHTVATRLSLKTLQSHFKSEEDCNAFGDRSTQRGATSESLGVDAPGSSHLASHREELKIVIVYGKGEGPLAVDGHDTLFTASEVEALNSLSADHSAAKSVERGELLVCHEELSVQQQTPDTISIKVEEDIGGGMPAGEDAQDIRDCSTQRGATSESLRVDAPGSSHMSSHSGELRILSVYGQGDHSVAKSLNCSVRLVRLEELTGHQGGCKGRPGVLGGKVFPNNANMIVPMRTHNDKKPYRCYQCMKRFSLKGCLNRHMMTHEGVKPYKCDQCTMCFAECYKLKTHMRTHTGEKPYSCDQCTMRFAESYSLKIHIRTHTGEKPYKCDQCVKRFAERSSLNLHMRTHTGEKPYRCDQCKKSFGRISSLRNHIKAHTGEKPYKCEQCVKRFTERSGLKIHMMTHTGEKPYKCDQCVKRFTERSNLKDHMRTHTGEKPYRCDQCKKSFGRRSTLRKHIKTHTGEKPYKCDQCVKRFTERSSLKIHIRTNTGERPYSCDQCTMRFAGSSALKIHTRTHPRLYALRVCNATPAAGRAAVPSSEPLKNQWVDFIFSGNAARVCAKHFTEDCFLNLGQYRTGLAQRLRIDSRSVPTLLGSATNRRQASSSSASIQQLLSRDVACQTDHLETPTVGTQLSLKTLQSHFKSEEDCDAFGDRSTQRGATSESLGVDAPGSSLMSSHSGELKILSVHGKGEGPLAGDGHDTLFTASEVEAQNLLSADHSVAKSLERGERLVCREELSVQQIPDTISIKVEEDIGGGMPAGEDAQDIRDCSTQGGATSESLRVDASRMSSHNGELRILSVYGQGEGPLAVDGHDTLFAASELEALSSLSADHSVAKSLNCSVRLVHLEELTGHGGGRKGRPGVLCGKVIPNKANQIHTDEKPYGCDQCMRRFSRKGYLTRHIQTHSGEKPYKCDQCMMRFQRQCDLKIHMRTHSGEKPYKCDQCTKRFSQKGSLKLHMRTHSGEKPYKCDQCTMSFSLNGTLKTHMRTHSWEKPYRCDQCTMSFSLKGTLKIHMWTHSREKPYKCDQCVKRYSHISALNTHLRTHTVEKPYKCDQCVKRFTERSSLKIHIRTHTGDRPYRCDQCTKSFTKNSNLKIHLRTHTGEKPYKCDQCVKRFAERYNLKNHIRTHTGEKPYRCDQCKKSFGLKSTLRHHIKTHTGEKPYRCDQCTMCFTGCSNLKTHMKTHTGEKPYSCDQCKKSFTKRSSLKIHMRTHTGEKPYKCDQCVKRFAERSNLKNHIRTHTGERPYRCDQCKKSFGLKSTLRHHIKTHTGEKPYKCDQCVKRFAERSSLKIHIKTHTGEKPYRCDQCTMCFSECFSLKIHMRTHTGEKPYSCDQCKKSFGRKDNMQLHMKTHNGEKPYSCDQCKKSFTKRSSLKIHTRTHPCL